MSATLKIYAARLVQSKVQECQEGYDLMRKIRGPEVSRDIFRALFGDAATEEFWILLLDQGHKPIGAARISQGTLTASLVHPREVFGHAIRLGAAAIIVAHNHPSGDPTPSMADDDVTTRLGKSGKLLGIPVVDHLIVTDGVEFYSYATHKPERLKGIEE